MTTVLSIIKNTKSILYKEDFPAFRENVEEMMDYIIV